MLTLLSALALIAFDDIPTKGGKVVKQDAPPQDLDEAERALREAEEAIRRRRDRESNANRVPGTPTPAEMDAIMRLEMEEAAKALERAAKAEGSRAPSAPPGSVVRPGAKPPAYADPRLENQRLKEAREASEAQMYKIILEERARLASQLGERYSQTDRDLDLPTQSAAVAPRYPFSEMPLFTPSSNAYVPANRMTPGYLGGDAVPEHRIHHMNAIRSGLEREAAGRAGQAPEGGYEERWGDATLNVKRALRP